MVTLLIDGDLLTYRSCFSVRGDFLQTVEAVDSTLDFIFGRFDYAPYRIFLTGKNNFRNEISTTYKANRDPSKRPKFYREVRDYLINFYGAEVSENCEADDMIGLNHIPGETVSVSYDKDLRSLEGTHFNWPKNEVFEVTYPDNIWFFYYQMLVGDTSDNIKGVPKIGDVKARKLLDKTSLPSVWKETVELKYQEAFGDQWFSQYDTNARLLWIQRKGAEQYYDAQLL